MSSKVSSVSPKENTKQHWLEFALKQLIRKGPDSLKIMPLCEARGVTKGSFYHHFKNRQDFIEQLMEHWYQTLTIAFIEQANMAEGPLQRLEKLDQVIAANNIEAEMHIRAWALKEPGISGYLAKVDNQRQNYLEQCYIELGVEPQLAKDIAMVSYAQFLGLLQIHPTPDLETMLRLSGLVSSAFFPGPLQP